MDLEKELDKINWKPLFKTRRERRIAWEDRTVILRLYKDQKTLLDINGEMREEPKLGRAFLRRLTGMLLSCLILCVLAVS